MPKSSIDYVELHGLRVALSNIVCNQQNIDNSVINWIKARIEALEKK